MNNITLIYKDGTEKVLYENDSIKKCNIFGDGKYSWERADDDLIDRLELRNSNNEIVEPTEMSTWRYEERSWVYVLKQTELGKLADIKWLKEVNDDN